MNPIPKEYLIAMEAALEASAEIMRIYKEGFDTVQKTDGSPVTVADLNSSAIISKHLEKTGIPIIGEELKNLPFEERKNWTENWCVDPLDGTKEFIKKNDEFCISIAHVKNGKPYFGLLAEPCKGRMIFGARELGVHIWDFENDPNKNNLQTIGESPELGNDVVWIASRSHESADAQWVDKLSKSFNSVRKIPKGSAIKFFDLALGNAQIYPRFAPTMEWDISAGQAILETLGGQVVSALDNQPLKYNKENLLNPHFVAKTKAFLDREKKFKTNPIITS